MNANPSPSPNSGSSSAAAASAAAAAAAVHLTGFGFENTTDLGGWGYDWNETWNETINDEPYTLSPGIPMQTPLPLWSTVILGIMAGVCSLVTVLGNAMVLFSFAIERTIRQPTNYFIASLAISDLLIGTFSMPFFTSYLLLGYWPMGPWLCDLWLSLDWTVCLASQYTVFLITMDRFCSVKLPAKYRNWRTERKVIIMIVVIWVLPISIFFTCIIGWQFFVGKRTVEDRECEVQFMSDPVFLLLLTIGYYWTTLIVMCGLYTGIYRVALTLQRKSEAKHKKISAAMEMATDQTRQGNSLRAAHIDKSRVGKDHKDGNNVGTTTTSFSSKRNSEKEEERSSSPAFASDDENSSQSPKPPKKPSPKDLPQLLCDIGKVPAGLIEDAPMATSKSHIKANGSKKIKGNLKFSTKQSQKGKNNVAESLNNRSMSNANTNTVMALYEPAEVKTAHKSLRSTSLVDKQNSTIPLLINETNKFSFEEGIHETENILKSGDNAVENVGGDEEEEGHLIDCSIPPLEAETAESVKLLPEIFSDETYCGDNNLLLLDSCEPEINENQNSPVWKRRSLVKYSASSPAIDLTASSSAVAEASYSSYEEDGGEGGEEEEEMTSLLRQCISQPSLMMTTTTTTPPATTISSDLTTAGIEPDIDNTAATILTMAMEEVPKLMNSTASDFSPHCLDNSFQFPDTNYEKELVDLANDGAMLGSEGKLHDRPQQEQQQPHQQQEPQEETQEQQQAPQQTVNHHEQQKQQQQHQLEEEQVKQAQHQQHHQEPQQKQEGHKLQKPHIANNQNEDLTSVTSKRNLKYSSPFQTIVKNMGKQKVRRRSKKEKTKSKSENRARKALRTITFILGAFVLCWTPYHLMVAIIGLGGESSDITVTLYNISYWLCYLNSPINPFCYAFANVQFKRTFLRILRLDWHRT